MASIQEQLAAKRNRTAVNKLTSGHDVDTSFVTNVVNEAALMPKNIDISYLKVSPENTYSYDAEELEELKDSILRIGMLDYPIVEKKSDKLYEILSGQKRFLAVSQLQKEDPESFEKIFPRSKIPCKVIDFEKMKIFGEDKIDQIITTESKRMFIIAAGNQQHEKTVRDYMLQVEQLSLVYAEMKEKGLLVGQRQREFVAEHTNMQSRSSQKVLTARKTMLPELWSALKNYEGLVSVRQLEAISKLDHKTQKEIYTRIKRGEHIDLNRYLVEKHTPVALPKPPAFWASLTVTSDELAKMLYTKELSSMASKIKDKTEMDNADIESLTEIGKKINGLRKKAEKIIDKYH